MAKMDYQLHTNMMPNKMH